MNPTALNQTRSTASSIVTANSATLGRVITGMSGGIDSTAAALLLQRQGYEVVGITLKLWEYSNCAGASKCCTPEDVRDARKVAFDLNIPFYVRDYSEKFMRDIVDYFTDAYLRGRTPNPCAMCNDKIKFSLLDLLAGEIAADYMGTGHYARVHYDESNREYQLLRGVDESRDQSYFLFRLGQNRLRRTLFPLGELRKQEVREILRAAQIGTPNKPESRELCFVENDLYAEFVEQQVQEKLKTRIRSGKIVNEAGETLGTHDGIHRFTVGQRKGIGIAAPEPLYVTRIDGENHTVVVGNKTAAYQDHCVVETVNWISEASRFPTDLQVQLRYRGTPIEAKIEQLSEHSNDHSSGASYRLQFQDKSHLPTPGQAAVFYDGERVLGGGWIA